MTCELVLNMRSEIDAFVENHIKQPGHTLSDPMFVKNVINYEKNLTLLVQSFYQSGALKTVSL